MDVREIELIRILLLLATLQFTLAGCGTITTNTPTDGAAQTESRTPYPAKVVLVILENQYADIAHKKELKFLWRLASEGVYLSNYYAVAHPSQPNYVALVSGSTEGVNGDSPARLDRAHLGHRLPLWMAYAEGYQSGTCDLSPQRENYVRRHLPFLSFADVQDNPDYCRRHITDFKSFVATAKAHQLPSFSLVIPDLSHDAHDGSLADADAWLGEQFDSLLEDADFRRDVILIVTFDENGAPWPYFNHDDNKVYAALWGDHVLQTDVKAVYDHYDLLRTIEAILAITPLSTEDSKAHAISGIWR